MALANTAACRRKTILVVALGRGGAREVVTVRREPGNGELRGDTTGLGQHVGESDATDTSRGGRFAPRRSTKAVAPTPVTSNFAERGEIHEAGPVAHRPALGRDRLPPSGVPERERHIARVIPHVGPYFGTGREAHVIL